MIKKKILRFFKKKIKSQDTRTSRRMRTFCLIRYNVVSDAAHRKYLANPRDISAGGVSFISKTSFPKGSILEMDIYFPPLKDFFTVMAKVEGSLKTKSEAQYLIRANFKAIDPEDKKKINLYIEQAAKNPYMQKYLDKKARIVKRRYL
ncbi:MAG: PilZ domain-containing protein [Candidatus Omnitrophica bacterium]|nr:PilZ domain-containing protein [Candidatus Omnitrophota bacterium]